MALPTDICLTVDAEFSIAGAFHDPGLRRPVAGQTGVERTVEAAGRTLEAQGPKAWLRRLRRGAT
ncbi:hypothetical protein [Caenispirillum salinarum]|uniref:hypothetical protein n=1 Tax=Caenispirillum salinarum TaxID=859058 RepID=UPI00384C006E